RATGRSLAGPWGGRLAVALLACEPTLLANAALATTDLAITACLLALVYHFRTGREAGWLRRVGLPAFWFAAAVLAQASRLVFGPLCVVVVELERILRSTPARSASEGNRCPLAGAAGWWTKDPLARAAGWCRRALRPALRDMIPIVGLGMVLVFVYCGSDWR